MQIWIIDNSVPIQRLLDTRVKTGTLPVDREGLQRLVEFDEKIWGNDSQLRELCKQLLADEDIEILAFTHPQKTLLYLEQSPNRPDIVFFDWDFGDGQNGANSAAELSKLYGNSFFLTQIFSSKPKDEIQRAIDLVPKLKALEALFLETKEKGKADLKKIIEDAETFYKRDFGALADPVRKAATTAVENTLRDLGALPIKDAMEVLGSKKDEDGTERGGVDDVADIFAVSLLSALQDAALDNIADDKQLKEVAIQAIASRVKTLIEEDKDILAKLRKLAEKPIKMDDVHRLAIQRLANFKMYHQPGDDYVRQGDIVAFVEEGKPWDGRLLLILNASCDLERYRKKTREILTCLALHPLTKENGFTQISRGENPFGEMGGNIDHYFRKKNRSGKTADGAVFFPSVASGVDGALQDYVGIVQEVIAVRPKKIDLKTLDKLTYKSILVDDKTTMARVCALNFSFVPAVLGVITKAMAGYGFPDLHRTEIERITKLMS